MDQKKMKLEHILFNILPPDISIKQVMKIRDEIYQVFIPNDIKIDKIDKTSIQEVLDKKCIPAIVGRIPSWLLYLTYCNESSQPIISFNIFTTKMHELGYDLNVKNQWVGIKYKYDGPNPKKFRNFLGYINTQITYNASSYRMSITQFLENYQDWCIERDVEVPSESIISEYMEWLGIIKHGGCWVGLSV